MSMFTSYVFNVTTVLYLISMGLCMRMSMSHDFHVFVISVKIILF
jgi:hypothetical protein